MLAVLALRGRGLCPMEAFLCSCAGTRVSRLHSSLVRRSSSSTILQPFRRRPYRAASTMCCCGVKILLHVCTDQHPFVAHGCSFGPDSSSANPSLPPAPHRSPPPSVVCRSREGLPTATRPTKTTTMAVRLHGPNRNGGGGGAGAAGAGSCCRVTRPRCPRFLPGQGSVVGQNVSCRRLSVTGLRPHLWTESA